MASKLGVYNESLRLCGERRLSSLTEARDARYHLDDAYDRVVAYCLEQGLWNHAMRAVSVDAESSAPDFGFAYYFDKPSDWVRTYIASASENLDRWLPRFNDEGDWWYADSDPIYVKYVSNSSSFGMDLGKWPESYAYYVSCRLALQVAPSIGVTSDDKLEIIRREEKRALIRAKSKDAMSEGPAFPPQGTWATSRGRFSNRLNSTSRGL